jgi:hypothetical protein
LVQATRSEGETWWVPRDDCGRLSGLLPSEVKVEVLNDGDMEVGDLVRTGLKEDFRIGKSDFRVGVYSLE